MTNANFYPNDDPMSSPSSNVNLIEEFMNITDEENKIINSIKEEFSDFKYYNYGALIYIQTEEDITKYPHTSELLENYEKIFSQNCYLGNLVLRQTKCNDEINIFSLYNL